LSQPPKNTSHNYVFAAFRENIHIMLQLLYIARQVVPNVEATPMGGCRLRHPNTQYKITTKWKIESCRALGCILTNSKQYRVVQWLFMAIISHSKPD
jgi:hypothetical protein